MPNRPVMPSVEEYQALLAERDALRGELRLVTAQRDLAEEKLRAYKHELFGASSEARHADQLGLFNEVEALATTTDAPAREDLPGTSVAAHTRGKRGRKPLDPNLPREVVWHELPESERFCAHDGQALVEIGVETSEQLDVIPEQVRVVQHQRVKYACPCCDLGIKITPAPARIIPRGLLTESALAWITGKYQYGMPLYHQATLLRRFGGDISSNTLAASVVRVGLATQPVINLMRDALIESDLIYGDEITFQVLKEPGRRPQAKSYLWAQVNGSGPPVRMFSYSPGRGAQHAQKLYAGVQPGTALMTDGYELYNGIAHDHQLVHLGCWAHVRRGFIKAEESVPKAARSPDLLATRFVMLIGKLFAAEARSAQWKPERRQRLRIRYSARVLAIVERMLIEHLPGVVPSSLLGKALQYMSGQWPKPEAADRTGSRAGARTARTGGSEDGARSVKKVRDVLCEGVAVKYGVIEQMRQDYPVPPMCRSLGVSVSGYYAWRKRTPSKRARQEARLETEVLAAQQRRTRESFGPERLQKHLEQHGVCVGVHRIKRLRRKLGSRCRQKRRFKATTNSKHDLPVAPNLLGQDFSVAMPDQAWCGDITYIATDEGWLYLAGLKDLYSGEIVGYAMSERMTKNLVMQALFRAVSIRPDSAHRPRLAILRTGIPETPQTVRHARVDESPRKLLR
ncbi:transposase [Paraburkholderia tropica]|nr:transposase [Paraburkholderia tropica]